MAYASVTSPRRRLADWVDAYEAALAAAQPCDVADFLPPRDDEAFLGVLVELVRIDMERAWRGGARPRVDAYLARFPELRTAPDALAAVAFEEYRQRLLRGENAARGDYAAQYGVNVSHWPAASVAIDSRLGSSLPYCAEAAESSSAVLSSTGRSASAMNDWPRAGQSVAGFELLAEIGRGAFARVYLARQAELADRHVVLKISDRFADESHAIAELQHTNIVPIYSQHRVGRFHALCMPYFGGTTLADALAELKAAGPLPRSGEEFVSTIANCGSRTRAIAAASFSAESSAAAASADSSTAMSLFAESARAASPTDNAIAGAVQRKLDVSSAAGNWRRLERYTYVESVLWLVARLADGLDHAHQRGVLHRDLKPANILLRDDGEPMLLDFNLSGRRGAGLAGAADADPPADVTGGTLPYMAPEQFRALCGENVAVGAAADIFSLGVVMHEMLTGERPFAAGADTKGARAAGRGVTGEPSFADVSPAVRAIVMKCLARDPANRYASAGDLAEDLRRQLAHLPLRHAANPSWSEQWRKWRRRHPRATSAAAVAGVAAAAIAVVSALWWSAELSAQHSAARNRAAETFAAFMDTSLDAQFKLAETDPSSPERRMGRTLAEDALAIYSPDAGEHGAELGGDAALLDETDRQRLAEELADLRDALAADERRTDSSKETGAPPAETVPPQDHQVGPHSSDDIAAAGESAHALFRRARSEYDAGRFGSAVKLLTAATDRQPRQVRYWMLRGRAEEAQQHLDEAIACYTACIVLKPDWAPAYVNRGAAKFRLQRHGAAIADFDSAVKLDDSSTAALVNRALAYQQLSKWDRAIGDLDRAIALEPDRTRFYHLRARLHRRAGNADLAARDEQLALARDPQDAEGWVARGVFFVPRKPTEALAAFEAALEHYPNSLEALRNRSHVLAEYLRRPREAVDALSRAIELYPNDAPAVLGRGVLYARLGRRNEALDDARRGLKLDSGPVAHYQAACIYALTSRSERADAERAIGLLFAALHLGFDRDLARRDPDLAAIRAHRDFARIVAAPSSTIPSIPSSAVNSDGQGEARLSR